VLADTDQPSPAAGPTDQRAGHQAGVARKCWQIPINHHLLRGPPINGQGIKLVLGWLTAYMTAYMAFFQICLHPRLHEKNIKKAC